MAIHFDRLDVGGAGNLAEVLEVSPDCVKILDLSGHIRSINTAGCRFLAQSSKALEGRPWLDFLPEHVRKAAWDAVVGAARGATLRLSTPCQTPGGTRHCDLTVSPLRDPGGAVVAILAITRDVTDLVQGRLAAEQSARDMARQSAALRAAGLVAKLGAWEIDYARAEIFWSDEIWTLLGLTPRKLALDDAAAVFTGDNREQLRAAMLACRSTGEPFALDLPVARADQSIFWVRIFGEKDVAADVLRGAVQDITAQRSAEAELVAARDAAQAASAAQSAFLANVSHEIRTPLHGILGMAQVMETEVPTALQRERLTVIRQSGETLMALLNDILDLSKIEAGRLELRDREFDLAAAIGAACAPFRYLAAERDLGLDVVLDATAIGRWRGDELRLRQVVGNLVSNAVKFTQAGEISVTAWATDESLHVAVSDTGPGIFPGEIDKLFDKFSQGRAASMVSKGTGLGLAISRELAQLMGGDITVESVLGRGSTFEIRVPFKRSMLDPATLPAEPRLEPAEPVEPLRVLAAEDNPTNQLILRSMLAPLGAQLRVVGDGVEAVQAFQAEAFDVILMDIQMPMLNGVDATKKIRAWEIEHGRNPTPIIALSANVMAHQVEAYLLAGIDDVVEKPIDLARLYRALEVAGERAI
ncbi:hybrid sensor histidine kinase/response regulator [Caulobacter flavus]|uniref:histidine kinase n=1 Tax=Caulobacter flavus TaxID=1679497 RepID=A0A2N5CP83_9CAUL|nr:ATP-binding protein [Caulobacter flavus]AYV48528.1 hybrid sensor histidine kinase/response regulator [Caulobacter flavus]PLR08757.1 hybrid sensor histidine kinase/response regulator [Caulobacter flavus]